MRKLISVFALAVAVILGAVLAISPPAQADVGNQLVFAIDNVSLAVDPLVLVSAIERDLGPIEADIAYVNSLEADEAVPKCIGAVDGERLATVRFDGYSRAPRVTPWRTASADLHQPPARAVPA